MRHGIFFIVAANMLLSVSMQSQGLNVPQSLAVGSDGTIYVAAQSLRSDGDCEIYVIAVNGSGRMQGSGIVEHSHMLAGGIIADSGGIRVGTTGRRVGGEHALQLNAFDRASLVWCEHPSAPGDLSLSPIWPNPVYDSTTASLELNVRNLCHARIDLCEVNGRITARMMDNELAPGLYTVRFNAPALPAGLYYFTLIADNIRLMKKLIVLR